MILELRGVCKAYASGGRPLPVLEDINLAIPAGQFAAIVGASGSGKSTLLGLMAGLDAPSSGSIQLDGEEIAGLAEDRMALLRGRKIGYVFQSFQLIPTLTAAENVQLPHDLAGGEAAAGRERARGLLAAVGLGERGHHYPVQLSGGEQQRVALARAFMARPPLLLADEPTGNLDSANGQVVLELLLRLNREEGTTLVLVTHDAVLAERAERVIEMRDGRIVADRARSGT
ncbi:MAG TPA: ABC transporter ATP-binding protein [Terriglobales bacterium]|nr:ABC transporter ATP-binding protein [Terriglobales bacterium]